MTLKDTRRENMRLLIKEAGSQLEFSKKVGTSAAYVSQVLSEKSRGDVGNRFARSIEQSFGLKTGWLDEERGERSVKKGVSLLSDAEIFDVPGLRYITSEGRVLVACNVEPKTRTFAYKMTSDEMDLVIPAGAVLICEPDLDAVPGDIAIITASGGVFVRRMQKSIDGTLMLKPENARYPVSAAPADMKIVGIVRESIVTTTFR